MGHSGIPTKKFKQTGTSELTVSIDIVDPFELDLGSGPIKGIPMFAAI